MIKKTKTNNPVSMLYTYTHGSFVVVNFLISSFKEIEQYLRIVYIHIIIIRIYVYTSMYKSIKTA